MTAPTSAGASNMSDRYANVQSEFVAVVLAATVGTRLFPLTDVRRIPKHLLPVAGSPILKRLIRQLEQSGFEECVVAIAQDDHQTVDFIRQEIKDQPRDAPSAWREIDPSSMGPTTIPSSPSGDSPGPTSGQPDFSSASIALQLEIGGRLKVTIVRLGEECEGSVGAINQIEATGVVAPKSNIVVLPGDLVLLNDGSSVTALVDLVHAHRQGQTSASPAACSMLLNDAGDQDENGTPLKESAKQKKGGLAREEDDIEYIALSYPSSLSGSAPRVVWKQSKLEAEEDKDMTGATPKLVLPKPRLRVGDITRVRSDWTDVHVYVLSPWVRRLLWVKNRSDESLSLISLVDDLLPLLITRQFLGVQETFGSKIEPAQVEEVLKSLASTTDPLTASSHTLGPSSPFGTSPQHGMDRSPLGSTATAKVSRSYSVLAHVQKSALRSATVPAYLYASKELVALTLSGNPSTYASALGVPPESNFRQKAQTVILPNARIGDKVTFKSTVVGRNCSLGGKCRLNNVILLDNVTLGENVSLQNTVVGKGAVLGDNCSLNECQVAPGKKLPSGTKGKSEAFTEDVALEG